MENKLVCEEDLKHFHTSLLGNEEDAKELLKVDGTSFSDVGSLVTTAHVTREICPRDLKYRKSKTNMGHKNYYLPSVFFPVCPRLDQNKSCPLGVSC